MTDRRLPAEWARQRTMLLVWPRAGGDWGSGLDAARETIATMTAALCRDQQVILACADDDCTRSVAAHPLLAELGPAQMRATRVANDDIWARDTGPITVIEQGSSVFADFRFDGWGQKFEARQDDRLTAALVESSALGPSRIERYDHVLEGGSIEANGAGTLLTTERCLLNAGRNVGIDRAASEQMLREALGVCTIHWLSHGGLIGDDTDGHIDTLARFAGHATIVYQGCADRHDAHFEPLRSMATELAALRDADGAPYRLIELPLPSPVTDPDDGHRLPAGYANFLIGNGCVLVPAFDDPADAAAQAILSDLFPDREIVPVDSRPLIRQHGGLHCAAMQIPAA